MTLYNLNSKFNFLKKIERKLNSTSSSKYICEVLKVLKVLKVCKIFTFPHNYKILT